MGNKEAAQGERRRSGCREVRNAVAGRLRRQLVTIGGGGWSLMTALPLLLIQSSGCSHAAMLFTAAA